MNLKYIYLFSLFIILLGCAQISEEVKEKTIQKLNNSFNDTSKYPGEDLIKYLPVQTNQNFATTYYYLGFSNNFFRSSLRSHYPKEQAFTTNQYSYYTDKYNIFRVDVYKTNESFEEIEKDFMFEWIKKSTSLKVNGFDAKFFKGENKSLSSLLIDLKNKFFLKIDFLSDLTPEDAFREYLSLPKINLTELYYPKFSEELKFYLSDILPKMESLLKCNFSQSPLRLVYAKESFDTGTAYCKVNINVKEKKAFYYNAINPFSRSGGRSELIKTEII